MPNGRIDQHRIARLGGNRDFTGQRSAALRGGRAIEPTMGSRHHPRLARIRSDVIQVEDRIRREDVISGKMEITMPAIIGTGAAGALIQQVQRQQLHLITKQRSMTSQNRRMLEQTDENGIGQQLLMEHPAMCTVGRPQLIESGTHFGQQSGIKHLTTDDIPLSVELLLFHRRESGVADLRAGKVAHDLIVAWIRVPPIAVPSPWHIHTRMRRLGIPSVAQPPLMGLFTSVSCVDELIPVDETFSQIMSACALQVTMNGEADITVDGRAMTHRPGNLFAIIPGVELNERVTKPWHVRYVMLYGPWCSPLIAALKDKGGAVMLDRPPKPWVTALNTAVDAGITGETGATWRIAAALATVLGGLTASAPGEGDLLAEVGHLVDAAPERPWSVVALARSLRLAPRTVQQRFRQLTGDGPARWILHRRMTHARLLLQRGMPVNAAAERLGFANAFHFSRAFKRCMGIAPSACRHLPA